jgi:hypothetical protein
VERRSASGDSLQQGEPEGHGDSEPDEQERGGDDGGGRLVTVEQEHREPGVDEEGDGAGQHAVRFGGGVDAAVVFDGEREGGERDRGRGAEKAGETLGAENGAEEGEAGDEESADEKAEAELSEHRGSGYAEDRGTRGEILQQLAHLKVAATKVHGETANAKALEAGPSSRYPLARDDNENQRRNAKARYCNNWPNIGLPEGGRYEVPRREDGQDLRCLLLAYFFTRGGLATGAGSAVLGTGGASQKPGVGMMNSMAIWVLPMKLGPTLATRQSSSLPVIKFSM